MRTAASGPHPPGPGCLPRRVLGGTLREFRSFRHIGETELVSFQLRSLLMRELFAFLNVDAITHTEHITGCLWHTPTPVRRHCHLPSPPRPWGPLAYLLVSLNLPVLTFVYVDSDSKSFAPGFFHAKIHPCCSMLQHFFPCCVQHSIAGPRYILFIYASYLMLTTLHLNLKATVASGYCTGHWRSPTRGTRLQSRQIG